MPRPKLIQFDPLRQFRLKSERAVFEDFTLKPGEKIPKMKDLKKAAMAEKSSEIKDVSEQDPEVKKSADKADETKERTKKTKNQRKNKTIIYKKLSRKESSVKDDVIRSFREIVI